MVRARHDLPTEWSGTLHQGTLICKKTGSFRGERCVLSITAERALKFVEDTVVLIQVAQLSAKVIVNLDRPNRSRVHVDVPDLEREIIPREHVSPILAELDVRYGGDNFGEEGSVRGVFLFFKFCHNE